MKHLLAAAMLMALPGLAQAEGDPAKGDKVFKKCMACHAVGADAKNKVGPILNNIVGGKVAEVEGYEFSPAFKEFAAKNPTWTPELLDAYLTNPRKEVPGTKMSFAGLSKEQDRADVIAYLATQTGS